MQSALRIQTGLDPRPANGPSWEKMTFAIPNFIINTKESNGRNAVHKLFALAKQTSSWQEPLKQAVKGAIRAGGNKQKHRSEERAPQGDPWQQLYSLGGHPYLWTPQELRDTCELYCLKAPYGLWLMCP